MYRRDNKKGAAARFRGCVSACALVRPGAALWLPPRCLLSAAGAAAAVAGLPALAAGFARFFRVEFVRGASLMRGLPALAAGLAGFLGIELMRSAAFMGRLSALAAGLPGFLRSELMGSSFLVRGLAAFAGDFALACRVHRREAAIGRAGALFTALLAALLPPGCLDSMPC